MKLSPLFLVVAACAATLTLDQIRLPTAYAQTSSDYQVRVEGLQARRTLNGVEVTGHVINTGSRTLTYTSAVAVLTTAEGNEAAQGNGYLTTGPLRAGESAEFRAYLPPTAFTRVALRLVEAGHPVTITAPSSAQASARRRTTVL